MAGTGPGETDTFVRDGGPQKNSKWQSFLQFLYNSKDGTIMGRTGKSWLQITIFYIIFYGVLAAFFAVLLILFLQTLDPNEPKWKTTHGIIGNVPGMGFRPVPADSGSTLIWVKPAGPQNNATDKYVQSLKDFLSPYEDGNQTSEHFMDCNANSHPTKDDKKICKFKLSQLSPCTKENDFGYKQGQPCVLLKLNKIYGWVPEAYGSRKAFPQELTDFYSRHKDIAVKDDLNHVYITCDGADNVDKEHMGPIQLHPPTLAGYYFPYTNAPGYLAPITMVQFLNPAPGVLINIECKAWANNIQQSRSDRLGVASFELLVDR
jgi:sodium/potassium-transporting ATPase subunit beta